MVAAQYAGRVSRGPTAFPLRPARSLLAYGRLGGVRRRRSLPDHASIGGRHGAAGRAVKRLFELGEVGDHTVDAKFVGRVRVVPQKGGDAFVSYVSARELRHRKE